MPYGYCECGCDNLVSYRGTTRVGIYSPGHRARLVQQLRDIVRNCTADSAIRLNAMSRLYMMGATVEDKPLSTAFGFEAEFFGVERDTAVATLNDHGINAQDDGYHHNERPYWRVTDDGSVTGEGNELVSPILRHGRQTTNETISTAMKALREAGSVIDTSCGLHVHHNATHLTVKAQAETIAGWIMLQPATNLFVSASRRNSGYCRPISEKTVSGIRNWLQYGAARWPDRFLSLNAGSYTVHGSFEFRQHQGTLNAEKIVAWSEYTRLFMRLHAKNRRWEVDHGVLTEKMQGDASEKMNAAFDYLDAPSSLRRYLAQRATTLHGVSSRLDEEEEQGQGVAASSRYDVVCSDCGFVECECNDEPYEPYS